MPKAKGKFIKGLFLGAAIGTVLGLLNAPAKGSETKKSLKSKSENFKKKINALEQEDIEQLKKRVNKDVKSSISKSLKILASKIEKENEKSNKDKTDRIA
ncbi:YtxH domain-containing protein [Candidatus Nomurabacteria bacterium]|uniref:YtxH domain-containing protein n=1 Tax=candidate division WWE3 bacterium TaxID=2053526 RepID=A0A955E0L4_UNCKA|nr:YtxH domain-containing protein [candidate division WWE3 bacterium]MCB9823830.1 YtxH domain-containing protein [Candidatus Nomurabacteria bacterium]MCB9826764.1 YtxH domain-containing protein [Candidatus Nomurabacteria bacterium]MCB9827625.1 YtxH domain-containing protein [Candidatus Nomurabacteria bacterium]HXK52477.1 YtxH domain-containing protein [bacterium]